MTDRSPPRHLARHVARHLARHPAADRPSSDPAAGAAAARAKPWEQAFRVCLCCGDRFASGHAGNRICEPCKGADEWLAAAVLEPFFVRAEKRR